MKLILTIALSTLMLSASAFAGTAPEGFTLRAYPPTGNGDPNAISCWAWRTTSPIRGLQCARNSEWSRLNGRSFDSYTGGSFVGAGPVGSVPTAAVNNR
jgi:hypothetical protein